MPISIIDVVEAPSIVFTPAKWSYDETVGGEKPRTHIEVNTSALLQSIEITRVKTSGQEPYTSLTFTDEDQQKSWTFDEMIVFDRIRSEASRSRPLTTTDRCASRRCRSSTRPFRLPS